MVIDSVFHASQVNPIIYVNTKYTPLIVIDIRRKMRVHGTRGSVFFKHDGQPDWWLSISSYKYIYIYIATFPARLFVAIVEQIRWVIYSVAPENFLLLCHKTV